MLRVSCSTPRLKPALEEAIAQFPLTILGFHSDNGSEYSSC
jgi:transposase InsO family protein